MTLTLTLTPDKETRLQEMSARAGLSPEEYIQSLIDKDAQTTAQPMPGATSPTMALCHRWSAENATNDPEEIKQRTLETDEQTAALRANPFSLRLPKQAEDTEQEQSA